MGVSAKKSSKGTSKDVESKKRNGDAIVEIFSSKKIKKSVENEKKNEVLTDSGAQRHIIVSKSNTHKEKRVKRSNKLPADGDLFGDSTKPRKKMSGLKIYTEEELGLNKPDAGGTPLCPFDCDCCF